MTKCAVCDEKPATLTVTVTQVDDPVVYDVSYICHDCARDAANEMCLILPPESDAVR